MCIQCIYSDWQVVALSASTQAIASRSCARRSAGMASKSAFGLSVRPPEGSQCDGGLMGPTLNQTLRVEQPLFGQAPSKQTVNLTGTPAKVGGWLWRVSCPETRQQAGVLYLAPDGDRFLPREATGLKYRRARSKADRALRRCFKLMQKLQTDHFGPGISKPHGMSDRMFDKLEWQLIKENVRRLCALLGRDDPEFHDEDPPPPKPPPQPKRPPQPRRLRSMVRDPSVYSRDKSGTLKMRPKFEKKFGLTTWTH